MLTHSPPQEDNLNSNEFTKRTWREQKPVLVDLHHQYEVIHYQHEVATDVRQFIVPLLNFNQPILKGQPIFKGQQFYFLKIMHRNQDQNLIEEFSNTNFFISSSTVILFVWLPNWSVNLSGYSRSMFNNNLLSISG